MNDRIAVKDPVIVVVSREIKRSIRHFRLNERETGSSSLLQRILGLLLGTEEKNSPLFSKVTN